MTILEKDEKDQLKKIANWKLRGQDGVRGHWLKTKGKHNLGKDIGFLSRLLFMDFSKLLGKGKHEIESLVNIVRVFSQ